MDLLTLSWPEGHICPTFKESFQVRWDKSIPLFLHAAIYLEVSLFRWTSQNAFSRQTALYEWYSVHCCIAALHTVSFRVIWWFCGSVIGNRKGGGYLVRKPIKRRNLTAVTFHTPVLWDMVLWLPKLRGNYCLYFELKSQTEDEEKVTKLSYEFWCFNKYIFSTTTMWPF